MGFPLSFISLIGLITAPSIICMVISSNHGLSIMVLNMLSLDKSWIESRVISLLVFNPIEGVWCSGVGLLAPFDLIRLVVLSIVPGMVSLGVWGDVRAAISNWIDSLLNKSWIES